MGLIKAVTGAAGGVLADQYREYFYCESMDKEVLVKKAQKKTSARGANNGVENIISNGSVIAVADGQCMIIVEQGKVVEFCAEPGEFVYDSSTEPSIFTGSLKTSIKETFKTIGRRIAFGGETAKDQRVYYFNTKELIDNKFGTQNPIQFKTHDVDTGLSLNVGIRCNGVYSYRIADPILFYSNVCANVSNEYRRSELDPQLKSEFLNGLQPAFAKISALRIDYTELPGYTLQLADEMNQVLSSKWGEIRGLEIVNIGINTVTCSPEDEAKIQQFQQDKAMSNVEIAAGRRAAAEAQALVDAANNSAGAMTGFMGMGFAAQQANNGTSESLMAMAQQQKAANAAAAAPAASGWKCSCGATANGNFCPECGAKKPEDGWKCSCGQVNKGKFCSNCGQKKPAGALLYKCDKCGWEPEDPANPPKFCPECGDPFDEKDIK
ncbi:MAG: SPFH domain-containing protein [Clostridia bacterium]|nr:SPFH domain-containing protein [Clostridia bacterium]